MDDDWNIDQQSRINGFNVYRLVMASTELKYLNTSLSQTFFSGMSLSIVSISDS